MSTSAFLYWICVSVVTVIGSARITRLAIFDVLPPIKWVRDRYLDKTDGTGWDALAWCAYCASFWPTLVVILTGWYWGWHEIWWLVVGSFAASYLSAIFVIKDQEPEDEH